MVEVAARPEEKVKANSAPSTAAKAASKQSLVGFPLLPYSYLDLKSILEKVVKLLRTLIISGYDKVFWQNF